MLSICRESQVYILVLQIKKEKRSNSRNSRKKQAGLSGPDICKKSGLAKNRLSPQVARSLEVAGYLAGYFILAGLSGPDYPGKYPAGQNCTKSKVACSLDLAGLLAGYLGLRPDYPPPNQAGLSSLSEPQRLYFGRGYKYPSPFRVRVAASFTKILSKPPPFQTPNPQDLPPQPLKFVDTWRIKGGDQDLQLHQPVLHFPL